MEEKEIWKRIEDLDYYEVSNMGRLKSLFKGRERVLKQSIRKGYNYCSFRKNGIVVTRTTHQLVAIAFLGHVPNGNVIEIDHINGIKNDNRLINLRVVTHQENCSSGFRSNKINKISKYNGVSLISSGGKWRARVFFDGAERFLGNYDIESDASSAHEIAVNHINNNTFESYWDTIKPTFTSEYRGVSAHKPTGKWISAIRFNGKRLHLGLLDTAIEASNLYEKALLCINNNTFECFYSKIHRKVSSNYRGVCWHKGAKKWKSQIKNNGTNVYLGYFATEIEAHNACQAYINKSQQSINIV